MPALLFSKSVQVQEIFALLFGGETTIREVRDVLKSEEQAAIGYYVDSDQRVQNVMICDFAFANSAGAALSLVPAGVVQQAVRKKDVDENLRDNLREVFNICANLFLSAEGEAVRLERVDLLPKTTVQIGSDSPQTFEVLFPRYPHGRIQLLTVES